MMTKYGRVAMTKSLGPILYRENFSKKIQTRSGSYPPWSAVI